MIRQQGNLYIATIKTVFTGKLDMPYIGSKAAFALGCGRMQREVGNTHMWSVACFEDDSRQSDA